MTGLNPLGPKPAQPGENAQPSTEKPKNLSPTDGKVSEVRIAVDQNQNQSPAQQQADSKLAAATVQAETKAAGEKQQLVLTDKEKAAVKANVAKGLSLEKHKNNLMSCFNGNGKHPWKEWGPLILEFMSWDSEIQWDFLVDSFLKLDVDLSLRFRYKSNSEKLVTYLGADPEDIDELRPLCFYVILFNQFSEDRDVKYNRKALYGALAKQYPFFETFMSQFKIPKIENMFSGGDLFKRNIILGGFVKRLEEYRREINK